MDLAEIIKQRIAEEGPISFHDFMQMSLYYPELGYYTNAAEKIGTKGDYYTSPAFTSVFGEMVAKQVEEMWCLMDKNEFTVVEFGGGTGTLCKDILRQAKHNESFYDKLTYCIIEKNSSLLKANFNDTWMMNKVKWLNSLSEIPEVTGCILSNELIDNFPVHRVAMEDILMEVYVDYQNEFIEILKPASADLLKYFEELTVVLPKGFRTEINLKAIEWIKEVANTLKSGFVITIDYGFPSSELYMDQRRDGTLMCYYRHTINDDPYSSIGRQDITAHVNFSALCRWGIKNGLACSGYTDQFYFLHALGIANHLREMEKNNKVNVEEHQRQLFLIHTLLMDLGRKLKVLIQQKGVPAQPLTGLSFSQPVV
ncbi:MAG: SAM-dependent methyltransferase [Chitinophagales bacterium]